MADVGGFFKHTLPSLALGVASGVPGPIGAAATLISSVLGKSIAADPAKLNAAVEGATPEQIIELRNQQQQFEVTLKKMGFDDLEKLAEITAQDRASARDREKALGGHDWTPKILAYGVVLGFFLCVLALFRIHGKPLTERDVLLVLLGALVSMVKDVFAYYFGSSAGSDRKTELLAKQ